MKTEQVTAAHRNGNLHIKISGNFNTTVAVQTTTAINRQYQGHENVFVHTEKIGELLPSGLRTFLNKIGSCPVQNTKLFLVGEKGLEMAPNGCRIIIPPPKKKSCGTCGKCTCR